MQPQTKTVANTPPTTNPDSLYLLVSADGMMFKIGMSSNVPSRVAQLKSFWSFDLERSMVFSSETVPMKTVEKTLHFLFSEHNVTDLEWCDGYTEWFSIHCFDEVVEEIGRIAARKDEQLACETDLSYLNQVVAFQPKSLQHQDKAAQVAKLHAENLERMRQFLDLADKLDGYSVTYQQDCTEWGDGQLILSGMGIPDFGDFCSSWRQATNLIGYMHRSSIFPEYSGKIRNLKPSRVVFKVMEDNLCEHLDHEETQELAQIILNFLMKHLQH